MVRLIALAIMALFTTAADATSFCAHRNGADAVITWQFAYGELPFPTLKTGSTGWAGDGWMPVPVGQPARTVTFSGQIWIRSGLGSYPSFVARIHKNGANGESIGAGLAVAAIAGGAIITTSMQDEAQPGDVYRVIIYGSSAGAVVDGNPLHTFWCGA